MKLRAWIPALFLLGCTHVALSPEGPVSSENPVLDSGKATVLRRAEAAVAAQDAADPSGRSCDGLSPEACGLLVRQLDETRLRLPRSSRLYRSACEAGDAYACLSFAYEAKTHIWYKDAGERNYATPERVAAVESHCQTGDADACYALSHAYREGLGTARSAGKAFAAESKACKLGHSPACIYMGDDLGRGDGTPADPAKAYGIFQANCTAKVSLGCFFAGFYELGAFGDFSPARPDQVLALAFFELGCSRGDPHACSIVGWSLLNGSGEEASPEKSVPFFEFACRHGQIDGCRNLARMYNGEWPEAPNVYDQHKAGDLFRRSCELGDGAACERAAGFFVDITESGEIVKPDAIGIWKRGCELRNPPSCETLIVHGKQSGSGLVTLAYRQLREIPNRAPSAVVSSCGCENAPAEKK